MLRSALNENRFPSPTVALINGSNTMDRELSGCACHNIAITPVNAMIDAEVKIMLSNRSDWVILRDQTILEEKQITATAHAM